MPESGYSPEVGDRWLDNVKVQTGAGVQEQPSKMTDAQAADYLDALRQQMLARNAVSACDPGDDRKAERGLHAGHQQRFPGWHDQRR